MATPGGGLLRKSKPDNFLVNKINFPNIIHVWLTSAIYERPHDSFFISWKDFFILYFISFEMTYSYLRLKKRLMS